MRFIRSHHLLVVMTCLFFSVGPWAADGDPQGAWAALPDALSGVRAAFLSNDAGRLARVFSRRAPVMVSVPPIADGCLAPGPMRAFLDRLVRERVSLGFELPSHTPPGGDGSADEPASVFIRVRWTHRPAASATLQVEYLHLALRYAAEDSQWQIVEMSTSRR